MKLSQTCPEIFSYQGETEGDGAHPGQDKFEALHILITCRDYSMILYRIPHLWIFKYLFNCLEYVCT